MRLVHRAKKVPWKAKYAMTVFSWHQVCGGSDVALSISGAAISGVSCD